MILAFCQLLYDVIVYLLLVGMVYKICVAKKPDLYCSFLHKIGEKVKQTNKQTNKQSIQHKQTNKQTNRTYSTDIENKKLENIT